MVELYYIILVAQQVNLELHLRGQERKQVVEAVCLFTAENKFVKLEQVISVLIYIDLQVFVERMCRQLVVVRECDDVIPEPFIELVYIPRPVFALVENALDTGMRVKVRFFQQWVVFMLRYGLKMSGPLNGLGSAKLYI